MEIFKATAIADRRKRTQIQLDQHLENQDLVLFFCGDPIQKPGGLDQTYPFLPHPEYFWLTGLRRPSGILAYSKTDGWKDFTQFVTREEKLWEGSTEAAEATRGSDISEFPEWLTKQNSKRLLCLGQPNSKQLNFEKQTDVEYRAVIQESINQVRRHKDASEVQLVESIAQIASHGYALLKKIIRPGMSERQIQIEYEAEVLRAGSEKFPYDTIVGSGSNAAVLHAIPTEKRVQKGELVLIDAGADLHDYCVDITRVFAADGEFSTQQKEIYELVLKAQTEAIEMCQPGTLWTDIHTKAARVITEGLKSLNLMTGETDSLLESGAVSTFLPHGVGHMVGLKVRDVGPRFNSKPAICCGVRLRVDLRLEENFMMTVEPGIYFVPALLNDSEVRRKYQSQINWSEVEKWRNFGGVRIEDDILVTSKGPRNLTALIPK